MKKLLIAIALISASAPVMAEDAAPAAAPAAAKFSVEASTIGDLIDNGDTKAILNKHAPGMADNPQIEMARGMTLKQIQGFAPDQFSDELLAKIEADLAAIK